jgi:hypothetical protein
MVHNWIVFPVRITSPVQRFTMAGIPIVFLVIGTPLLLQALTGASSAVRVVAIVSIDAALLLLAWRLLLMGVLVSDATVAVIWLLHTRRLERSRCVAVEWIPNRLDLLGRTFLAAIVLDDGTRASCPISKQDSPVSREVFGRSAARTFETLKSIIEEAPASHGHATL